MCVTIHGPALIKYVFMEIHSTQFLPSSCFSTFQPLLRIRHQVHDALSFPFYLNYIGFNQLFKIHLHYDLTKKLKVNFYFYY